MFQTDVIHHLTDIFDESFWKMCLMQAMHTYPAVWHAAIATAATFNSLSGETGKAIMDSQYTIYKHRQMALIHCNKAIQCLREVDHANLTLANREMLLIACMLLAFYSTLRGKKKQEVMHMRNGVYLSRPWYDEIRDGDTVFRRLPNCVASVTSITLIFRRLEMQPCLAPPFVPIMDTIGEGDHPNHPSADVPFNSALEAYAELMPLSTHILRSLRHVESDGSIMAYATAPGGLPLRKEYFLWSRRFQLYYQNYLVERAMGRVQPDEIIRAELMHIRWLSAEPTYLIDPSEEEMAWDKFEDSFRYMIVVCERLLPILPPKTITDRRPRLISPHGYILGSAMSRVINSCRNAELRQRVIDLLELDLYVVGMGRSANHSTGKIMMRLEEDAWQHGSDSHCQSAIVYLAQLFVTCIDFVQ
ncbi:hypothetical protein VHEMI02496 [[Torrubiella] hemipterigena]|uniref:C6 zinc finger domain protein n=1 Tax=[Torrubiella] hemipterigena TaxID=1531966 RepID=A0A0A1SPS3_9HYPO|nr:hypothetical protein VHEMI02496 [[Torrubiella] hemipterigena]